MTGNPWTMTTRTWTRARAPRKTPDQLLAPGDVIQSPETNLQYTIDRMIGAGGFGEAYLAQRIGRSAVVPATVCIKVSTRKDGWLREAYFGQVLDGHERAIRVFDAFPLVRADGRVHYFLALEYAEHGMLILGDASRRIRRTDVRGLRCSDHLKEIVHRCIGERRKRYESAEEMIDALRTRPAPLKSGVARTLKGLHVTFTGIFKKTRKQVAAAARRAGAFVHSGPSAQTSVIVRGRPNALQAAGRDAGLKLMEIKRLREKGHRITVLSEAQFWRLATRRKA